MEKHLYYYPNHATFKSSTDLKNIHNVVYCDNEAHIHYDYHDYSQDYFTTVARENGTISFNLRKSMGTDMITSISYSTDDGETWATTTNQNNKSEHLVITVNVSEGDKVMWKGNATQLGYYDEVENGDAVGSFFSSTCEFDVQGNVMSLLYGDGFKGKTTIENDCAFACLFYDYDEQNTCEIVNAKNLSLPATTLTDYCYNTMFNGCTSLTTAPELPATTLASYCYAGMFIGCTSLTTAPEFPAATLTKNCYSYMFNGCTNLKYIKAMFTTTPSATYTENWVNGVASTGTFVKNAAATWNVTGVNGIPSGWTVETASN